MFKLSLRELFLLVTLAAVGTAWWLGRCRQAERCAILETSLATSEAAVASEKLKAQLVARKLGNLYHDACKACAAHGLHVQGAGTSARLVENNGENFQRSTTAAAFVVIDGEPNPDSGQ